MRTATELPFPAQATSPSDVLSVELLQRECGVKLPLRVVPLFEKLADLQGAPAAVERLFSVDWYRKRINGKQEVMIGYSDSGKDAGPAVGRMAGLRGAGGPRQGGCQV